MNFKYGDSWEKYPIESGEVWAVGRHRIACGDLEAGDGAKLLRLYPRIDHVFVDPPWNKGNARCFRTKAQVDGEKGNSVDFDRFLTAVIDLIQHAHSDVLIEFGCKELPALLSKIRFTGGNVINVWDIMYYNTRPCQLVHATWSGLRVHVGDPTGMDEMKIPEWFFNGHGGEDVVLFDPCMGQGLAAVAAARCGMNALGLELNKRRAAVTLGKLAEATGESPRQNGTLDG